MRWEVLFVIYIMLNRAKEIIWSHRWLFKIALASQEHNPDSKCQSAVISNDHQIHTQFQASFVKASAVGLWTLTKVHSSYESSNGDCKTSLSFHWPLLSLITAPLQSWNDVSGGRVSTTFFGNHFLCYLTPKFEWKKILRDSFLHTANENRYGFFSSGLNFKFSVNMKFLLLFLFTPLDTWQAVILIFY